MLVGCSDSDCTVVKGLNRNRHSLLMHLFNEAPGASVEV